MMFADPIAALVELSSNAEMIVVGSRGRSALRRALFGSVSSALVRRSQCPVAVIHDEDPLMPRPAQTPVLLGVGSSAASDHATRLAREERCGGASSSIPDAPNVQAMSSLVLLLGSWRAW